MASSKKETSYCLFNNTISMGKDWLEKGELISKNVK
jgi:hypothetical protein